MSTTAAFAEVYDSASPATAAEVAAVIQMPRQQVSPSVRAARTAVGYAEPALIVAAAAIWLHVLAATVRFL